MHGDPEYSCISSIPSPQFHRDFCLPRQLHYFLEDDTIEIRSLRRPNSGRDSFPVMLRRGKIPKSFSAGDTGEVYHWKDFGIGVEVSVRESTQGPLHFYRHRPNLQIR